MLPYARHLAYDLLSNRALSIVVTECGIMAVGLFITRVMS